MQAVDNRGAFALVSITYEHAGSKDRAESGCGNVEVNREE
jgi:hypothetical protein